VKLLSFSGKKSGADNILDWTTTEENNSDHFELEYSKDGSNFVKIATVNAKGWSATTLDYAYTHAQVTGTAAYYRLKIVDKDLNFEYSNVVLLKRSAISSIDYTVYPNPFADKVTVNVTTESATSMVISLFDMSGKQVRTQNVNLVKGDNRITVDRLNSLTAGTYIMTIKNNETQVSTKLMKAN
jgi:hypothetical protein